MKISEYIYSHLHIPRTECDISDRAALEDFFAALPPVCDDEDCWPLSQVRDKGMVSYHAATVHDDKFGMKCYLECSAEIKTPEAVCQVGEMWEYDGDLRIEIGSVLKKSGKSCGKILYELIKSHRAFMKIFERETQKTDNPAKAALTLYAHSGQYEDIVTSGGYVWALQGFDFSNEDELKNTRYFFKYYMANLGIDIKDKDLELFTKPCHFAVFQCGKKVNGHHLGKDFLLGRSWQGIMRVPERGRDPEEYRFAKAYYENKSDKHNLQAAAEKLNPKFLRMMKKYYNRYREQERQKKNFLRKICSGFRIFG